MAEGGREHWKLWDRWQEEEKPWQGKLVTQFPKKAENESTIHFKNSAEE